VPSSGKGVSLHTDAPYDAIPVFVRAGSILPYGPDQQYIGEKSAGTLTLHVYEGADGAFTLYEDQGLTYDYEKGAFTEIPIKWSEATHTLTIGKRKGSYPQMLARRRFEIVVTSKAAPVGYSAAPKPVKVVSYEGAPIAVTLP
jgi:alpha-D-xyloside xylohydrolase